MTGMRHTAVLVLGGVLVLDEATSHRDAVNERQVREALRRRELPVPAFNAVEV